jgi:hypothetical protein
MDLRIMYMRNKITEKKFKMQIQKRDKEHQRDLEISNILRMFISCTTDLFYRILEKAKILSEENVITVEQTTKFIEEIFGNSTTNQHILKECHALREYTNECMKTVLKTYDSTLNPYIDEEFVYRRTKPINIE